MTNTAFRTPLARRLGWGWIALSSLAIAAFAVIPYFTSSLQALGSEGAALGAHYAQQAAWVQVVFYIHVVAGGIALVLGPFQFARSLRERRPRVHRMMGRVLVFAMLIAAAAGLTLAPVNSGGLVGTLGFGTLALLWGTFTVLGFAAIRRRDVATHRRWMIRAFALTYAAVTLRLWIPVLMLAQVPFGVPAENLFPNAYLLVPFLCWVPNLIVAEFIVRRAVTTTPATDRPVLVGS